jgi:hypothetical protein
MATPSGGASPYNLSYSGLPTGCTSANRSSLPCTPSSAGTYTVLVLVIDSNGNRASNSTALDVLPSVATLSATLTASPASVAVNGSTTLTTVPTGGVAPYQYEYSDLPSGCTSSNSATLICSPTASGVFHPNVTVTDAGSHTARATTTLTVTAAGHGSTSSTTGLPWWVWLVVAVGALLVLFFFFAARRRKKAALPDPGDRSAPPVGPPDDAPPPSPGK